MDWLEMSLKCPVCSGDIVDGSRYCGNCGWTVGSAVTNQHGLEELAVGIGVVMGCSGYLAGGAYKYWPGPPYLPYVALVAVPPAIILIVCLEAAIRERLFPRDVRGLLPSFSIAFALTYLVAFCFYYFIRV